MAERIAENAYIAAGYFKTITLSNLSLKGPANITAAVAFNEREATAQPNSIFDKLNSGSIYLMTPEITDASSPINNPPIATTRAMSKTDFF